MRSTVRLLALVLFLVAVFGLAPAGAQDPEGAVVDSPVRIGGRWTGAKLRCIKEENRLVRCGTPAPFEITFDDGGTGSTPDENLPRVFDWRWIGPKEIVITPKGGGEQFKLFAVEHEGEEILTFQAYIYLPAADPNAPAEVRYIHYVFDVNRAK